MREPVFHRQTSFDLCGLLPVAVAAWPPGLLAILLVAGACLLCLLVLVLLLRRAKPTPPAPAAAAPPRGAELPEEAIALPRPYSGEMAWEQGTFNHALLLYERDKCDKAMAMIDELIAKRSKVVARAMLLRLIHCLRTGAHEEARSIRIEMWARFPDTEEARDALRRIQLLDAAGKKGEVERAIARAECFPDVADRIRALEDWVSQQEKLPAARQDAGVPRARAKLTEWHDEMEKGAQGGARRPAPGLSGSESMAAIRAFEHARLGPAATPDASPQPSPDDERAFEATRRRERVADSLDDKLGVWQDYLDADPPPDLQPKAEARMEELRRDLTRHLQKQFDDEIALAKRFLNTQSSTLAATAVANAKKRLAEADRWGCRIDLGEGNVLADPEARPGTSPAPPDDDSDLAAHTWQDTLDVAQAELEHPQDEKSFGNVIGRVQAFLEKYPEDPHATDARKCLNRLRAHMEEHLHAAPAATGDLPLDDLVGDDAAPPEAPPAPEPDVSTRMRRILERAHGHVPPPAPESEAEVEPEPEPDPPIDTFYAGQFDEELASAYETFELSSRADGAPAPGRAAPPPARTLMLPGDAPLQLVLVSAGEFQMGSPDSDPDAKVWEKPVHTVRIPHSFYLAMFPVTQLQYRAVTGRDLSKFKGNDNPVDTVSWFDCVAFCEALSVQIGEEIRLPWEAEWEYACRAGTTTRFHYGDGAADLDLYAWFDGNSRRQTHPVGGKRPNPWGLCDMYGNVWEWCRDTFADDHYRVADNAFRGPDAGMTRVLRGGSWGNPAHNARSAARGWALPGTEMSRNGFRIVVAGPPAP